MTFWYDFIVMFGCFSDMVESVKHAIVLLQIAKNSSCHQSEAEAGAVDSLEADLGVVPGHEIEVAVDKSEEAGELVAGAGAETDSRSSLSSPRRSPAPVSPRSVIKLL